MIGNDDKSIMEVDIVVNYTELNKALNDVKKLKQELAELTKLAKTSARVAKIEGITSQIADLEKFVASNQKAEASIQKLTRTQDALSSRNVGPTATRSAMTGLDNPEKLKRAWKEYSEGAKNLKREFEATKESIEDVAEATASLSDDYLPNLTRQQRKVAEQNRKDLSAAAQELTKNKPGERPGQTDAAFKAAARRVVKTHPVPPGRFVGSEWISTLLQASELSSSAVRTVGTGPFTKVMPKLKTQIGNAIDLVLKRAIITGVAEKSDNIKSDIAKFMPPDEFTSELSKFKPGPPVFNEAQQIIGRKLIWGDRVGRKVLASTPVFEHPENLRGRSDKDEGIEPPLRKEMNLTTGTPTIIPKGQRPEDVKDRAWYYIKGIKANFKEAGLLLEEVYSSGTIQQKQIIDSLAALTFGTDVYPEAKEAFKTLPARHSKEGVTYKKELGVHVGKAHPISGLYSTQDAIGKWYEEEGPKPIEQRRVKRSGQSYMPSKRIQEERDLLVGEKKEKDFWETYKDEMGKTARRSIKTPIPMDIMVKRTPKTDEMAIAEAQNEVNTLRKTLTEFERKVFSRKVVPGEKLRRYNEKTRLPEVYGQKMSITRGQPEGDPTELWNEYKELTRNLRVLKDVSGSHIRPLQQILRATGSELAANLPNQKLGLGKYFDPLKLMDPSYMPNIAKGGWMGKLGSKHTVDRPEERGLLPQKVIENLGFIKDIDVTGLTKLTEKFADLEPILMQIKKMTTLYRGEALPHQPLGPNASPRTGKWFTDDMEEARYMAARSLYSKEKYPVVKSVDVPTEKLKDYQARDIEYDTHYVLPTDVASKAKVDREATMKPYTGSVNKDKYNNALETFAKKFSDLEPVLKQMTGFFETITVTSLSGIKKIQETFKPNRINIGTAKTALEGATGPTEISHEHEFAAAPNKVDIAGLLKFVDMMKTVAPQATLEKFSITSPFGKITLLIQEDFNELSRRLRKAAKQITRAGLDIHSPKNVEQVQTGVDEILKKLGIPFERISTKVAAPVNETFMRSHTSNKGGYLNSNSW